MHRSRAIFTCEIGSLVLEIAIFAIARVRIPGSLHYEIAMTTSGTWNLTGSAMLSSITVSVELSLFWFNFFLFLRIRAYPFAAHADMEYCVQHLHMVQ